MLTPLIAPCGHDCSECKVYIATMNNDIDALTVFAAELKANTGKEVPPADLACEGCLSEGRKLGFCAVCQIRACAIARNYANCSACPDLPCEKGKFIWKDGSFSLQTLLALRDSRDAAL